VEFGTFHTPESASTDQPARELYNSEFLALAYSVTRFQWAAYGFNSGHIISTIEARKLLFSIGLACDPYAYGRALFNEVAKFQNVLHGASALLDHICTSSDASPIEGYIIHSHCYQSSKPSTVFWLLQASTIEKPFRNSQTATFHCLCPSRPQQPQCYQICAQIAPWQMGDITNNLFVP
jgi:hypothetical protein